MVLFDLYIIYNESGTTIQNYKFGGLTLNTELIGPFLSALSTFAMEAMPSEGQMRLVDRGNVKILFEQGKFVTLALFASDSANETREVLSTFLRKFEDNYKVGLKGWKGDLDVFSGLDDLIKSVFNREKVTRESFASRLLPKPIPLDEMDLSKGGADCALPLMRAAMQYGLSGILSMSLNEFKIKPIGYISFLRGKGYAAIYSKPNSKVKRGVDAARHIIFDCVTLPAWVKFRRAYDAEIETDVDKTVNKISSPLNRIMLDALLLRHQYDDVKSLKPKADHVLTQDQLRQINERFGEPALRVLRTSQGKITVGQLVAIQGMSSLEITEILMWAVENGLVEMVKV